MVTRTVRHHDQDERDHDGAVHWDTIYPVLQRNIEDKIGRRCTYKDWIEHIHFGSSKTRFEYCLNSRKELVCIRAIQEHTGGIITRSKLTNHVLTPYSWKEFIFHTGPTNILSHRLDSWQEGRKAKKEVKPFSSRLFIHVEVMHTKKKNRVKNVQNQEKSIIKVVGDVNKMPYTG